MLTNCKDTDLLIWSFLDDITLKALIQTNSYIYNLSKKETLFWINKLSKFYLERKIPNTDYSKLYFRLVDCYHQELGDPNVCLKLALNVQDLNLVNYFLPLFNPEIENELDWMSNQEIGESFIDVIFLPKFHHRQISKFVKYWMKRGVFGPMEKYKDFLYPEDLFLSAIKYGHTQLAIDLYPKLEDLQPLGSIYQAVKTKNEEVQKLFAVSADYIYPNWIQLSVAIREHDPELFKKHVSWIHPYLVKYSVKTGNLEIIKTLWSTVQSYPDSDFFLLKILKAAIRYNHMEIFQYFLQYLLKHENLFVDCVKYNRSDMLKLLLEIMPVSERVIAFLIACQLGCLEIVEMTVGQAGDMLTFGASYAAGRGHVKVLQFLKPYYLSRKPYRNFIVLCITCGDLNGEELANIGTGEVINTFLEPFQNFSRWKLKVLEILFDHLKDHYPEKLPEYREKLLSIAIEKKITYGVKYIQTKMTSK